jgi:uncharacterized protein YyaL (SSP411 family)
MKRASTSRSSLRALFVLVMCLGLGRPAPGQSPKATANRQAHTNRLIGEKSPYLLLHAHNPVDWYPWGEAAFAKARRENKPIFLSIGYYTCHWCHVMERESYSNPAIAALLNKWFVSVKVDREERPDVDRTYITFLEATSGGAGWPANIFLTPDLKPFFGGTYFPPEDREGRAGLRSVLPRVAELWRTRQDDIKRSASDITLQLAQFVNANPRKAGALSNAVLDKTYQQIKETYDATNGGFGGAPKFARPVAMEYLLRYWWRTKDKQALDMTLNSLRAMARGGVHDHLGGGFHRYSTDAHWRVPHFEKMLYDQAQLAIVYTEAYQITHDHFFAEVARDIIDFTLREMHDAGGGFYSALDADSQLSEDPQKNGEGAFYVWTASEIRRVLGEPASSVFSYRYGVQNDGNVPPEQDIEGWLKGKNVLFEQHSLAETAQHFRWSQHETDAALQRAEKALLTARAQRRRPPTDTKIVTAWNGLMISALAKASQVFDEPKYLQAAERTMAFLRSRAYRHASRTLAHAYRNGVMRGGDYLDDYAFLIQGLLDLYETDFDPKLLTWALQLQSTQCRWFWDDKSGGYFTTRSGDRSILFRTREAYDGVEPSPSSVAAMNLLRIWQMTDGESWKQKADKTVTTFSAILEKQPEGVPFMASAFDYGLAKHKQVVIVGRPGRDDTRQLLRLVWERYMPNRILMLADGGEGQQELAKFLSVVSSMRMKNGKATAYVCENYVCNLPTPDATVVARLLDNR